MTKPLTRILQTTGCLALCGWSIIVLLGADVRSDDRRAEVPGAGAARGEPAGFGAIEAGAAVADITPPVGMPLWGYAARHDWPSVGVTDPLKARALVLSAGPERAAFVSLDLGRAPTRASVGRIRAALAAAKGPEHLFLVASHTHHGPVLELENLPTPETSYVRRLERRLSELILEADKARKPARIGITEREVAYAKNRHSRRPDRPVDQRLGVMRFEDAAQKTVATVVNFAAHPTMADPRVFRFSADYPGALARLVEKDTGAPCLFLQGAAGDLSPNAGGKDAVGFGEMVGRDVLDLASAVRGGSAAGRLTVVEDEFVFRKRLDLANPFVRAALGLAFFPALIDFYDAEYRGGVKPRLTTSLLDLGGGRRVGIVGVSGEVFCGHALSLRRRARLDHVFFLGYCNDYHQYFPTIEAAAEGGYGTDGPVSPVELGAGEKITDTALIRLYQMSGALKTP